MQTMTALSLEDLAATSDDAAVRRRFDARNLAWLRLLLVFFLVVSGGVLVARLVPPKRPAAFAGAAVLLTLVVLIAARERPLAANRWVRKHVNATVIIYLLTQYVLLMATAGTRWHVWAFIFPLLTLALRMLVSELLLVHAAYYAVAAGIGIVTARKDLLQLLVLLAVFNTMALTIELIAARRLRRQVIADWSERRSAAQEQLRMRDELQYARAIQISMLPEAPPQLDWVDLAGVSIPATEVGGDYFDYFTIGDRLAIVSGDVAGHGLASGLVLAALRSGFTLLRDSLHDPAAVLRRLHDLIAETTRHRTLVTCAVLLLDRATGRATIASAGHPPVIARRNGIVQAIELFAPPLGVRLPVRIPQREVGFASGDLFVLHTDGVYESVSPTGESYGMERIEDVVRESGDASAAEVRDALIHSVERFRGGGQMDDLTVVVARII
jgi:serine phosphatase RsbU (regulator of sigma subunit)